jgi:hypothetical protein
MSGDRKTAGNGRRPDGKFGPGNTCAANNRRGHLMTLRKACVDVLTVEDMADVMAALLSAAKGGDVAAIKVLFERIFGRVQADATFPEDEAEQTDDEKRQALLKRFAKLPPEIQDQVRSKLKPTMETKS